MRRLTMLAALLPLLGAAGQGDAPAGRVVTGDGIVESTLNDIQVRLRIEAGAPGTPVYSAAVADRAGLRAGPIGGRFAVGPHHVAARSAVARIDLGGGPARRRVMWTDPPYARGADGAVGPSGLPDPVVTFRLRAPAAGERAVTLPMEDASFRTSTHARIEVDGVPIRVRFEPHRSHTLATAAAAARIATAHGGVMSGAPAPVEIAFGIARPVRELRLERPLAVGPIAIHRLGARTGDYGSTGTIPDADEDREDIVVEGQAKRRRPHLLLSIGADALANCSEIRFDKPARQVRLRCA